MAIVYRTMEYDAEAAMASMGTRHGNGGGVRIILFAVVFAFLMGIVLAIITDPSHTLPSTPTLWVRRPRATVHNKGEMWKSATGKSFDGPPPIIAPSLLAADLANLASEAKRVMDVGADVLHIDVMDGHFVPNLSWGAPVIKCLRSHSNAFFDTHLMVSNPAEFVGPMADAGVDMFTFHIEANMPGGGVKGLIQQIRDAGLKVGIAIKPKTPIDNIFPYVDMVDLILIMTVEPGFGGQGFMADMMPKVRTLREKYPKLNIEVNGGLSPATVNQATEAGANAIVAGSASFVAESKTPILAMRNSVIRHVTGEGKFKTA